MSYLNPQPLPPERRVISVRMPHEILYDLEAFQRVQASVLGRVGCPTCTSGRFFFWQAYEDFAVNPAGQVRPVIGAGEAAGEA